MKASWQKFISEYCKTGDHIEAYKKAYPQAKTQSARVNGLRLLNNATIKQGIKQFEAKVSIPAAEEAKEELKVEIKTEAFTAARKKEILRLIAEGKEMNKEYRMQRDESGKKVPVLVGVKPPTLQDRMKAIELHNKMTGDDAPIKQEVSGDFGFTFVEVIDDGSDAGTEESKD